MKTLAFIFLLIFAGICVSWDSPAKETVTENREVAHFDEICVSTAIQVILQQGKERAVKVEAAADVVSHIATEVRDRKLVISLSSVDSRAKGPMRVYVTVPGIKGIDASSAASVTSDDIWEAPELELEASSAANIRLAVNTRVLDIDLSSAAHLTVKGEARQLEAEVSSAAHLNAQELVAQEADIEVSGAAAASVYVEKEIKYEVSGAAKLSYKGNPQVLKADVSQSGKVSR